MKPPVFWERVTSVGLRILLIEDEAVLSHVIARNLSAQGYAVDQAFTAVEGITKALEVHPDLLLLDISLPDRSGWDVLRELGSRGMEVRTVVISAVMVSPARLAEFNPVAFLPKPFPLESLLRIVEDVSERNRPTKSRDYVGPQ